MGKNGMPKNTPDLSEIRITVEIGKDKYGAKITPPKGLSLGITGEVERAGFEAGQMVSRTIVTHYRRGDA